jgi:hypothetical protein
MGYRSDVALYMYAKRVEDAPAIKLWLKENFPVEHWEEDIRWTDKGMLLEVQQVKWYDDYDDVKRVDHAMDDFEDLFVAIGKDTPEGAYEFVRIGEDMEDMVHRGRGDIDYVLTVDRRIIVEV